MLARYLCRFQWRPLLEASEERRGRESARRRRVAAAMYRGFSLIRKSPPPLGPP